MTHYEILGVAETAPQALIEAAWKIQMKECHPDLHKGKKAAKQAQVVNEAHDILSDPHKRAAYDLHLQTQRSEVIHGPAATNSATSNIRPIDRWPTFDPAQGFYPPAYGNVEEDPAQYFALKVGEAFLEALTKKNPALKHVFRAAKGAMNQ